MATRIIAALEAKHCPNSTDGSMPGSNHRIGTDGFCTICDRSIGALSILHGI